MQIQQVIASFLSAASLLNNEETSNEVVASNEKDTQDNNDFVVLDADNVVIYNGSNGSNETYSNAAGAVVGSNGVALGAVFVGLAAFLL